jgi:hypothetical protein
MAQADLNVANQSGAAFRSDLNGQLLALGTLQSGASAPSTTYAYMQWADTTTGLLKIRDSANAAWITVGTLASTNLGLATLASPTFTGTPAAPTATAGTNTTQIATTAFVATSYAPLASPTFTGTPAAPTATAGTSTTQVATTAFVGTAVSGVSSGYAALTGATFTGNVTVQTSSQPQFILNSTASGSWKSNIRFQNSGTAKYEIGADTNAAGANNFYFYDAVAAVNRATIDASGYFAFDSGYGSAAKAYGCRAWVNFNGTTASPSTIRGSGNVSSVTKNGTGDYTVNFTTAMPDTNYAPTFGGFNTGNGDGGWIAAGNGSGSYPAGVTTASLRLLTFNNAGASQDQQAVFVQVFR